MSRDEKPLNRQKQRAIADLAVLPVFLKLQGKAAIVVGAGEGALWKADLLAAAGADVTLLATHRDHCFDTLMDSDRSASFQLIETHWQEQDFSAFAVVIGEFENKAEAGAFYTHAKSFGVPVNVIDTPDYCDFQFGSIVNRSPVVVGISTDGTAPVLGQAIRRKIERLLPPFLSEWAERARDIRASLNKAMTGLDRRALWQRFADRAFLSAPSNAEEILSALQQSDVGSVTLVGAGPGNPDLLTVGAIRAIQTADVILFDDLVSDEVLEQSRREAQKIHVGKRGGRVSCKQDDINTMMLTYARKGLRVVRLKSGDPSVFGRSGEEIEMLEQNGIDVSVIPGVTAASAMAAEMNVSLTHRKNSRSVRYITGHKQDGRLPDDLNWKDLARTNQTLIFYMGGRTAPEIRTRLVQAGLSEDTPVAISANISRPSNRSWRGHLGTLVQGIEEIGYAEPVLIGIGKAFEQAEVKELTPELGPEATQEAGIASF